MYTVVIRYINYFFIISHFSYMNRLSTIRYAVLGFLLALVSPLYADTTGTILDGETVFQKVVDNIFSPLYKLVAAIAGVYFLFGVAKFIYDMNDPEKKNFGKSHLLWGTIGLFIIVSIGGILPLMNSILGGMFSY
jgi:hypothetical protein